MNINRLRHFIALSEERHFSRAAARVHLSQPALSRSIQMLEEELGIALFDRGRSGVTLTAPGQVVVERARRILLETGSMAQDIELLKRYQLGSSTFGAGPHPAAALVPKLLVRALNEYPDIKITVEIAQPENLLEQLRGEHIDFYIAATDLLPAAADLVATALPAPRLACFVAAHHPLAKKKKIELAQLYDYPWAATRATSLIRDALSDHALQQKRGNLVPAVTCEDLFLLIRVALETQAILVAPHAAVRDELLSRRLVALPLDPALFQQVAFGVVRLARRTPSPAAALLMDMLGAIGADLSG